ncbi:LamG-like jellyroll fold domain-containing protein [Aureibacter tunicatorum]|uniref:Uncharacterized protein n=1 Tax=Aureibacter tunicatorum TaxID=866807 RepID=A0AAE4BU66_9BACT|nr:LamG-like jellyroll fold domain-containing protein [Aureibacter tunicatorum]MDR6241481.1 hypothetical protein [Aureibacter tunicatorum]BDD06676.1 hypothetical protein AUTU_41590 [Aureibacter tunicatorum]
MKDNYRPKHWPTSKMHSHQAFQKGLKALIFMIMALASSRSYATGGMSWQSEPNEPQLADMEAKMFNWSDNQAFLNPPQAIAVYYSNNQYKITLSLKNDGIESLDNFIPRFIIDDEQESFLYNHRNKTVCISLGAKTSCAKIGRFTSSSTGAKRLAIVFDDKKIFDELKSKGAYLGVALQSYPDGYFENEDGTITDENDDAVLFRTGIATIPYRNGFYSESNKDISNADEPKISYSNQTMEYSWESPENLHYGTCDYTIKIGGTALDIDFWQSDSEEPFVTSPNTRGSFNYSGQSYNYSINPVVFNTDRIRYTLTVSNVGTNSSLFNNFYQTTIVAKGANIQPSRTDAENVNDYERGGGESIALDFELDYWHRPEDPKLTITQTNGKAKAVYTWQQSNEVFPRTLNYDFDRYQFSISGSNFSSTLPYANSTGKIRNTYKIDEELDFSFEGQNGYAGEYKLTIDNIEPTSGFFEYLANTNFFKAKGVEGGFSESAYFIDQGIFQPNEFEVDIQENGANYNVYLTWKSPKEHPYRDFFYVFGGGGNILREVDRDNAPKYATQIHDDSDKTRWEYEKNGTTYTFEFNKNDSEILSDGSKSYNLAIINTSPNDEFIKNLHNLILKSYIGRINSSFYPYVVNQSQKIDETKLIGSSSEGYEFDGKGLPDNILEFYLSKEGEDTEVKVDEISPDDFSSSSAGEIWTIKTKLKNRDGWLTKSTPILVANSDTEISANACDRIGIRFNSFTIPNGFNGTASYRINRRKENVESEYAYLGNTTQTTYEDTQVEAAYQYTYQNDIISSDLRANDTDKFDDEVFIIDKDATTLAGTMKIMPSMTSSSANYDQQNSKITTRIQLSGGDKTAIKDISVVRVNITSGSQTQTRSIYNRDLSNDPNIVTLTDTEFIYHDTEAGLNNCETYYYTFTMNDDCDNSPSHNTDQILISNNISNTFTASKNLITTYGYFEDYVDLEWQNENERLVQEFEIYRALFDSENDNDLNWTMIDRVSSGVHQYIDRTCQAGKLYKYRIDAIIPCNGQMNTVSSYKQVGFRTPRGVVSGHVEYSGGQEVRDAKIRVTHVSGDDRGSALKLSNGKMTIQNQEHITKVLNTLKGNFTFEIWLNFESTAGSIRYDIVHLEGENSRLLSGYGYDQNMKFATTYGNGIDAGIPSAKNKWHQYTITSNTSTGDLKLYKDGDLITTTNNSNWINAVNKQIAKANPVLNLLMKLSGSAEEIRLWDYAKTNEEIELDHSKVMSNEDNRLVLYYSLDEAIGDMAYDQSCSEDNIYNKIHSQITATSRTHIKNSFLPTPDQLGYNGYTDEYGNHIVYGIRYTGNGESFKVTPSKGIHEFAPSSKVVFIGDGSRAINSIDFEDISSFEISGTVTIDEDNDPDNSSLNIPVADAIVKVDGEIMFMQGEQVITDENGAFTLQVPIGAHTLTVEKEGHIFRNTIVTQDIYGQDVISYSIEDKGKFIHNFQENLYTLEFKDVSRIKMLGKVVGGQEENSKEIVFGEGVNNIGQANITFKPQNNNYASIAKTVETQSSNGEYYIELLPIDYIAIAPVASKNGIFTFSDADDRLLKLSDIPLSAPTNTSLTMHKNASIPTHYDTLENMEWLVSEDVINHSDQSVDSVRYTLEFHEQLNFKYTASPQITVQNMDLSSPLVGLETIILGEDTLNVNDLNLDYPLYSAYDSMTYTIRAFEQYQNLDNASPQIFNYPVLGEVIIQNQIGNGLTQTYALSQEEGKDYSEFIYGFHVSEPNTQGDFLKSMAIDLSTDSGIYPWDNGGSNIQRGYVLGTTQVNGNFVTAGPDKVKWILRDPPGSNSYAYIEQGASFTEYTDINITEGSQSAFEAGAKSEFEKSVVVVVPFTGVTLNLFEMKSENVSGTGFERQLNQSKSKTMSITTTTTETIQTSAEDDAVGGSADLFVGYAQNYKIGESISIELIKDGEEYKIESKKVLGVQPSDQTYFAYNQNHIKHYIVPQLMKVRNNYLENYPSNYVSKLNKEDDYYGLSNDSEAFGDNAVDFPDVEIGNDGYDGPSYTFSPTDNFSMDSVHIVNIQISEWVKALRQNESYKHLIKEQFDNGNTENLLRDFSVNGGAEISYEKEVSIENAYNKEFTDSYNSYFYSKSEGNISIVGLGTGYELENKFLKLKESSFEIGNSESQSIKWGFAFSDPDQGDRFNFKVSKPEFNRQIFDENRIVSAKDLYNKQGNDWEAIGLVTANLAKAAIVSKLSLVTGGVADYFATSFILEALHKNVKYDENELDEVFMGETFYDFQSPVFISQGGISSCPHEAEEKVVYSSEFEDNPSLGSPTLQRDVPRISVNGGLKHHKINNVPDDQEAVFLIELSNLSESGDARVFDLKVLEESNPDGAIVKIDGINPNRPFSVPAGTMLQKELSIKRGSSKLQYDSLMVVLHAQCQYWFGTADNPDISEIADTLYLSASFLPTCTQASISAPEQNWTFNLNDGDNMSVKADDYDINYYSLEKIILQYKAEGENDWLPITDPFYRKVKTEEGLDYYSENGILEADDEGEKSWIPQDANELSFDWEIDALSDGNYSIRAVSYCFTDGELSETYSDAVNGAIDRSPLQVIGKPEPSDEVYSIGDELSITFNENINQSLINTTGQLSIKGSLNRQEVNHDVSVSFDGIKQNLYVPFGPNLSDKSVTIEFWAQHDENGQKQVVLSQGKQTEASWESGFTSNGDFYFSINGERAMILSEDKDYVSSEWNHYAAIFDDESKKVQLFVNSELYRVANLLEEFKAEGPLLMGEKSYEAKNPFKGKLHELRIWTEVKTGADLAEQKFYTLSGSEQNLQGYWPMDILEDGIVTDKAKNRHAEMNAAWSLAHTGFAYDLASIDSLYMDGLAFSSTQDLTIEFWFKANQSSVNQTIFSNGKGTADDYNTESWNVSLNEEGKLVVSNRGIEMTSAKVYHDQVWHHFAMTKSELEGVQVYMDGEMVIAQQDDFGGFASAKIFLGSRYWQNGTLIETDQAFEGVIDEVRIWNVKRNLTQIRRYMRQALDGDEAGLLRNFTFESYRESMGLVSITKSQESIANGQTHGFTISPQADHFTAEVPVVNPTNKIIDIPFTYVANEREIVFDLAIDPSLVEGQILEIGVDKIEDLYGNTMNSAKTWTAYFDQNGLAWSNEKLELNIPFGEEISFENTVINKSGKIEQFQIENMPHWLYANIEAGNIDPQSQVSIRFEVTEGLPVGNYAQELILTGDQGYKEKFDLSVNVSKPAPEWKVAADSFEVSMQYIGRLKVAGIISRDENDMVAAFINGETRGVAQLEYVPSRDLYIAFMTVYGHTSETDAIEFKMWDASHGQIRSQLSPTNHAFESNSTRGSVPAPIEFEARDLYEQHYQLKEGWNWVSFGLSPDQPDINDFFASDLKSKMLQIKDVDNAIFSQYSALQSDLVGTLDTVNVYESYFIKMSAPASFSYQGEIVDPSENPLDIHQGWNTIGYLPRKDMMVSDALASLSPENGDIVKSRHAFSVYYDQYGWIGNLDYMRTGEGYMLYSANGNAQLIYPQTGMFEGVSTRKKESSRASSVWSIEPNDAEYSMTAIISTDEASLDEESILGAFIGDRCIGYAEAQKVNGLESTLFFVNMFANENDQISFRLIDANGEIAQASNQIAWQSNQHIGSTMSPLMLEFDEDKHIVTQVYPTIIEDEVNIIFQKEEFAKASVSISDLLGKPVKDFSIDASAQGRIHLIWNGKGSDNQALQTGIYFVKIDIGQNSKTFKLLKK